MDSETTLDCDVVTDDDDLEDSDDSDDDDDAALRARIARALSSRHDEAREKETAEALRALSILGAAPPASSRRSELARSLSLRRLDAHARLVAEFGELERLLDGARSDVVALCARVDAMHERVRSSNDRTSDLVERTQRLKSERDVVDRRLRIANAFVEHFRLTPAESAALHGVAKDDPVHEEFFAALDKTERLRADCRLLVHAGFETAALDLMEKIGLHREAAVERLYRWAQGACRAYEPGDRRSLAPRALAALQSRPALLEHALDERRAARKAELVRAFIDALAGGPDPIEHKAHDPKRYVSDILAWIHRALPPEKEALQALFGLCRDVDVEEHARAALADISEGLCHPLRVRADLISTGDGEPNALCAVADLLGFYERLFAAEIGGGALHATVGELRRQSEAALLTAVEKKVARELARGVEAPPSDLTPSKVVTELLKFLRDLLASTPVSGQKDRPDLIRIASLVVDPLLRAIDETACRLPSTDMAAYLLNCIYQIQCTASLLCQPLAVDLDERLRAQADAQMDTLTAEQASSLVANLNLGSIYTILQEHEAGAPLSKVAGMEPPALRGFMAKLDAFIASPDAFLLPQMALLMSSSNRKSVRKRAFQVIVGVYEKLHASLHDPANGYENPQNIVRRSPDEVIELLSIGGRQ